MPVITYKNFTKSFKVENEIWYFTDEHYKTFSDKVMDIVPTKSLRYLADEIKPYVEGTWYL